MTAMLLFSAFASALVFLAGRGDKARDPRLTVLALALLAVFPLLVAFLPKIAVLPVSRGDGATSGFAWMNVLLAIWFAGSLLAALRLIIAAKSLSGWRIRSLPLDRIEGVEVRQLRGLKGPVAAGIVCPVIFVPEEWSRWPDSTRRIVIDHEMAHHRRRDPLWRWIAEIACAVHCYNPLVIWMTRRLTIQCEYACDAMVLQNGVAATDYARLLCEIAEDRAHRGPVLAMAERSTLESRVRRLVSPRQPRGTVGLVALVILTFAFAAGIASMGSGTKRTDGVSPAEVEMRWSADPFPGGE